MCFERKSEDIVDKWKNLNEVFIERISTQTNISRLI